MVNQFHASVNIQTKNGTTPIFHAVSSGRLDIVKLLISGGNVYLNEN